MHHSIPAVFMATLIALACSATWGATTVKSSKSNSQDRITEVIFVTASTPLDTRALPTTVYTTPHSNDFFLTGFCTSPVPGGVQLTAGRGFVVAFIGGGASGAGLCYDFGSPGRIMPKGADLNCIAGWGMSRDSFCSITGIEQVSPPAAQ